MYTRHMASESFIHPNQKSVGVIPFMVNDRNQTIKIHPTERQKQGNEIDQFLFIPNDKRTLLFQYTFTIIRGVVW